MIIDFALVILGGVAATVSSHGRDFTNTECAYHCGCAAILLSWVI